VARLYPSARLLKGAAARRHRVTGLLPEYPLFHFAGHAVHNVEQPELSYLALAPDTAGGTGVLYAWEIPELRLSNVRVAVLSACSTLGPRPSRAGPTTGLAYSFLRAGVPATVSTAWDVDDRETTELLVELHRRLAGGASVAEALRQAQLWALRSPEPKLNAPETWAAFIYAGP
jgi:CHAT domain-containing protein